MKVLIIPDVHTKIGQAENIIKANNPDHTVFLGDYFDDFGDSPEVSYQVAEWLKQGLGKKDRTYLIGNHDISYITNGKDSCSGWDGLKQQFVNKAQVPWEKMASYYWVDDWLCTHAGLTFNLYNKFNQFTVKEFLEDTVLNNPTLLRYCSRYRGGRDDCSGIFWCDYAEFENITSIKQIFGHTSGQVRHVKAARSSTEHYCIDTGLKYYAIHENNKMTIKRVKK